MEPNYQTYLALIIECETKQDSSVQHEWIFTYKNDAVKVKNYLRNHGYLAVLETRDTRLMGITHYVGVPFQTLKIKTS